MPGEQVRPQANRQRYQPQEVRQDLDRKYQQDDRAFDASGQEAFHVSDRAVVLDALVGEQHEDAHREDQRIRHVRVGRVDLKRREMRSEEVELRGRIDRQRDVADQIRHENEDEDRRDQREVFAFHALV